MFILSLALCIISSKGQNTSTLSFNTGVDINSRYVWRGLLFSDSPNIQPYMSLGVKGFSAMAWASYATSKNYAEVDLFLSYTTNGLTLSLNDYFSEDELDMFSTDYSEWTDTLTNHLVEASITYQLPFEKLPLVFTASTFIYGADLDADKQQNYSSYFEIKYPFSHDEFDFSMFMGATTGKGFYADKAALVNLGVSVSRPIKLSETFSIPFNTSLLFHPYHKDVFFVVGISL